MKFKIHFWLVILGLCIIYAFSASCRADSKPAQNSPKTYSQNIKTDVAWIVLEWNGRPFGYGSGFLINREKGTFYTNRHVRKMFDTLGKNSHKLFFNGKVYRIDIDKTFQMDDAAEVRIIDSFDPSEFPEPAPFAEEEPGVGDLIFVGGMHPHPYYIREQDEAEGFKYEIIPIFRDYFLQGTKNIGKEREMVYEIIDGKVVDTDVTVKEIQERSGQELRPEGMIEDMRNKANLYTQVKISKDHKFSFGGLSGSPAKNMSGEIVGILTMQDLQRFDYDKDELQKHGAVVATQLFDTVYVAPIKSIRGRR